MLGHLFAIEASFYNYRMQGRFLLPFVILVASGLQSVSAVESPVIRTKSGPVRGKLVQLREARQDVYEFTGIPFAEAPIGERRFRKPVPKKPWSDVFDATKLGKFCLQIRGSGNSSGTDTVSNSTDNMGPQPGAIESEDCLQLNIWVPRATLDSLTANGKDTNKKLLPVYVFIHGGSFIFGSTAAKLLNGTLMSGFDNIIFVAIQYRLGVLGFAYFGINGDAPGNVGLWDQMEALKWISENIAPFGGNSSQVTIGGESAGAASVAFHLLSPQSRRYFQRAIIESGSATSRWAFHTQKDAIAWTDTVLNLTKCTTSLTNKSSTDEKIKCLRSLNATELATADGLAMLTGHADDAVSIPVIDGDFVLRDPVQMLTSGDFYKVPLLIGANREEGSVSLISNPYAGSLILAEDGTLDDWNNTHYVTLLKSILPPAFTTDDVLFDAIRLHYWPSVPDSTPRGKDVLNAAIQAVGDYALTCPTYNWAKEASPFLNTANGTPGFVYQFTQQPPEMFPGASLMGATHGAELPYALGEPFQPYSKNIGYTFDDRLLSKIMMEYWGNFIKYGDPNVRDQFSSCDPKAYPPPIGPGSCPLRNWPPYLGDGDCSSRIFELSVLKQGYSCGEAVSCGLKSRDCSFWGELFPKLVDLVARKSSLKP